MADNFDDNDDDDDDAGEGDRRGGLCFAHQETEQIGFPPLLPVAGSRQGKWEK